MRACDPEHSPARRRTRPLARRGRATLLWGLAFFALANAALVGAMEWRWPGLRDVEFGFKLDYLRRRLAEDPERPLLLVLGSSRTGQGFRPGELPPCRTADGRAPLVFNFSQLGSGPLAELVCLRRILRQGIRPDWVAVEVLPPALGREADYFGTGALVWSRLSAGDLRLTRHYAPGPATLPRCWLGGVLSPWYAHRFSIMNCWAPGLLPCRVRQDCFGVLDPWGWSQSEEERSRPDPEALDLARRTYAAELRHFHVQPSEDRALRALLRLCRKEGIGAVLYLMPEGDNFRGWYPPAVRAEIEDYLAAVGREFAVPVVDARRWMAEGDFRDSHHLTARGGRIFSRRFGAEVVAPLVQGRHETIRPVLADPREAALH